MMLPFKPSETQTHSGFASKSGMHGNEEQNEGWKMEVDSVIALELRPTGPEVVFGTGIFFDGVNNFDETKCTTPILAFEPAKVTTTFSETTDQMLFGTMIKDKHANLMVEFDMEEGTSILIQPEPIAIHVATITSLVVITVDPRVDVKVEKTKVAIMEK
jgi:hypothetical protein